MLMTGLHQARHEHPLQSRPSRGDWIVSARQLTYPLRVSDHKLDLSAPLRLVVPAGTVALLSRPAFAGVELVLAQ
jgi:hypothetical protein